jgi:branched-chain amino acid transport system permease protein
MITVGLAMGIAAVLQMTIGTRSMSLPPFAKIEPIHLSKVTISPQAPWLWLTLLLTMFGLVFLFNHTYWGKQIRACHQRHLGAILIGLNPSRIAIFIYAFAAGLAGILGVAMAGMIPVVYHRGTSLILMGFIVYLVGGATSLPGAVIAGLAIGLIESLTAAFISTNYMDIVPLSITIVFLLFRPTGLFGESEPGEK